MLQVSEKKPKDQFLNIPSLQTKLSYGSHKIITLAEDSMKALQDLTRNGTQLLEVMTELAQVSSESLKSSVETLHQEVVRIEDVRTRMNDALHLSEASLSSSRTDLKTLLNYTRPMSVLVEAIAFHSGWMPAIFERLKVKLSM